MPRFIALYLPQFHRIPENDLWWGNGFTEWTNTAKARPLFKKHEQPHIPADFGFYDLRYPEIKELQAALAREAGIEGFCYYHYWFGDGKMLLEKPFNQVLETGKPDYPFCLAWANHSWFKKAWNPDAEGKNIMLIEQTYPGDKDYIAHFNYLLPAFKDRRYIRVNGKLFFIIYDPIGFKDVKHFIELWRELAKTNGLNDFYFVATDADSRNKDACLAKGFDAIHNVDLLNIHHNLSTVKKVWLMINSKWFHRPRVFEYKDAIKYMVIDDCRDRQVIPVIGPNWDHTPRSGYFGTVLKNPDPKYFKEITKRAINIVKDKPKEEQIIIIKSWNEWGEGNYMEPDIKYGRRYVEVLKEAISEFEENGNSELF